MDWMLQLADKSVCLSVVGLKKISWVRRAPEVYSWGFSFEIWPETDSPKLCASWFLSGPTNAPAPEDAMASFHIFFQCIVHCRPPSQW